MEIKKIKIKSLKVKKDSLAPDGYLVKKATENGLKVELSTKASLEITKRLEKDKS